jgi:hypothetical protein
LGVGGLVEGARKEEVRSDGQGGGGYGSIEQHALRARGKRGLRRQRAGGRLVGRAEGAGRGERHLWLRRRPGPRRSLAPGFRTEGKGAMQPAPRVDCGTFSGAPRRKGWEEKPCCRKATFICAALGKGRRLVAVGRAGEGSRVAAWWHRGRRCLLFAVCMGMTQCVRP